METTLQKGPKSHRAWMLILNILLGLLVYWLLGFMLDDIRTQPGPSWEVINTQYKDPSLISQREALNKQISTLSESKQITSKKQQLVQININSYRDTMNQLLELQRSNLKNNQATPQSTQQNLAQATNLYLSSQQSFQVLNNELIELNAKLVNLNNQYTVIGQKQSEEYKKTEATYNKQLLQHNLELAFLELLFLIPILCLTAYFYVKKRETPYGKMYLAMAIAVVVKVIEVTHEYFPSRYFKYFLIIALIFIVIKALISLIRMMSSPQQTWLLKQYKEAYKKLICPTCEYPITPGLFKFILHFQQTKSANIDTRGLPALEKYSCPGCGQQLFEKCVGCEKTRHSLLPYCESCGIHK